MDENLATAQVPSSVNGAVTGYGFDKETHIKPGTVRPAKSETSGCISWGGLSNDQSCFNTSLEAI